MTTFGVIFLGILTILLFLPYKYMVGTLIIVCPFMVTSAASVGGKYIQPYLLCEVFIVLKSTFAWLGGYNMQINKVKSLIVLLLCFVLYCTIITLIGPNLFDGMEVVGKNLDDSYLNGYKKLHFSNDNVAQLGYLFLNTSTLLCIFLFRKHIGLNFLRKAFIINIFVTVVLGYWEFLAKTIGLLSFPTDLLMEGKGDLYIATVNGYFRMSALCTEASTFGAFIASAFWAIAVMNNKRWFHYILLLAILGALVLSMSGTGFVTFGFGLLLFSYQKGISLKYLCVFAILCLSLYIAIEYIEIFSVIHKMLTEKSESQSGQVRYNVSLMSIMIFLKSVGFGIGLGSTRSSSFILDLLAQIGLIGTFLLAYIFKLLVVDLKSKSQTIWIFFYSFVLLFAQAIAEPDFSYSFFWMGLFIAGVCFERYKLNLWNIVWASIVLRRLRQEKEV